MICKNCKNYSLVGCCKVRSNTPMFLFDTCPKPEYFNACIPEGKIDKVGLILNNKIYALPNPKRHCHLIRFAINSGENPPIHGEQGFLTENYCFLNRQEAMIYAKKIGQIKKGKFNETRLFSEDLW